MTLLEQFEVQAEAPDTLVIDRMRCYFFYSVPLSDRIMGVDSLDFEASALALRRVLETSGPVIPVAVPPFYTEHYRRDHAPHLLAKSADDGAITLPVEQIKRIPFFEKIDATAIQLTWSFSVRLQSIGLIRLCLDVAGPLHALENYHLSGLYLDPAHRVIPTEHIRGLWPPNHEPPPYISCDELARALHAHRFAASGLPVERHRPLRHEMQIPVTVLEVETRGTNMYDFVGRHQGVLSEYVFKPACWETSHPSIQTIASIFDTGRVWCPSDDSLAVINYNGIVLIHEPSNDDRYIPVSHFRLTSEESVLHTLEVGITNYYHLRVLDNMLDREIIPLALEIERLERSPLDTQIEVEAMHNLTRKIMGLRLRLSLLLEELDNPDKLIDEEWHVALLGKVNEVLGTATWSSAIGRRIEQLSQISHWVETWRENSLTLEAEMVNKRMEALQPLFIVLALAQVIPFFVELYLGDVGSIIQRHGLLWPLLMTVPGIVGCVYLAWFSLRMVWHAGDVRLHRRVDPGSLGSWTSGSDETRS